MKPLEIVRKLLGDKNWVPSILGEASVALPKRGSVWIASYTGPRGQETRSTGSRDKITALKIAREFEAAARAERARLGDRAKKPRMRLRHSPGSSSGLTQEEVAALMRLSTRAVRQIEKRALWKLAQHPALQQIWLEYRTGELNEQAHRLSRPEVEALLGLVRTGEELQALLKVLALVQGY
jgi:Sigma-70, region 4